jgi:hypothetical protein
LKQRGSIDCNDDPVRNDFDRAVCFIILVEKFRSPPLDV